MNTAFLPVLVFIAAWALAGVLVSVGYGMTEDTNAE